MTLAFQFVVCVVLTFGAVTRAQPPAASGSPIVTVLRPSAFMGEYAIWGATGSNQAGHVFLGVSSTSERAPDSAHLLEFNPATGLFTDRGSVVGQLERLGLRRSGETQMKIHSRIVEAADGFQYFASMDETGEEEDGSKLPTWGSHLWRRGPSDRWEHLASAREALIAVAAGGPYVYSLGYFNHVLYQFDARTRRIRSVTVGSAGGHVSRNLIVDDRGHAFVPRVVQTAGNKSTASLVEFDTELKEAGSRVLNEYFEKGLTDSHGIVAVVPDGNHGWYFATGKGRLYQERPAQTGPFTLDDLGWIHPAGPRYAASMFRNDETGALYAVAMPSNEGGRRFEWITRSTRGTSTVAPFPYGDAPQFPSQALVYGSMTHDTKGRFFVVGTMDNKPLVLQVAPTAASK